MPHQPVLLGLRDERLMQTQRPFRLRELGEGPRKLRFMGNLPPAFPPQIRRKTASHASRSSNCRVVLMLYTALAQTPTRSHGDPMSRTFGDGGKAEQVKTLPTPRVWTCSEFAREKLGFEADEKQRMVLDSTAKTGILNCSRQWGKSTVMAVKAVHRAWTRRNVW